MPFSKTISSEILRLPSATIWSRLEPRAREGSMQRSLQSQVRDPLWMLARQWQVGEFQGDDAGSPVQATISVESRPLTAYRPGLGTSPAVTLDPDLPLEAHVEREPVLLDLRGAVQLGLRFEAMAGAAGAVEADLQAFRQAFPIPDPGPDPIRDPAAEQFRRLARGRVTDGGALYQAILAGAVTPPGPWVAGTLADFKVYRESLYSEPNHDSAWSNRSLEYDFATASRSAADEVTLEAAAFSGGHLDWYSFSPTATPLNQADQATVSVSTWKFMPNHVTFRGMPGPSWWDFEDSQTDFGQLDAEHVDLAKLLVMEFALIYGNDWFRLPVPQEFGSLSRIDTLVVTDTFGLRTVIRPTEAMAPDGVRAWSMFKVADRTARSDWLLLPPTLATVQEGAVLEEVLFLRDEMAAMAWAVEKLLQGPLDSPVDGYEAWRQRLLQDPSAVPTPPQPTPGGPEVYYLLETTVPDNWIPMVPVQSPKKQLFFRRGLIYRPTQAGPLPVRARGQILDPPNPFFVTDVAVPRAGVDVTRRLRRTRWIDGRTLVWMARRARPGRGPGWSGLAYDLVEKMGQLPPQIVP